MAEMPKQWRRVAAGKKRPKLRYGKKRGKRLLGTQFRTAGLRVEHYCHKSMPDCIDYHIRPGDTYRREVWLCWYTLRDGTVHSYIYVEKTHEDPPCTHDPWWEEDERKRRQEDEDSFQELADKTKRKVA